MINCILVYGISYWFLFLKLTDEINTDQSWYSLVLMYFILLFAYTIVVIFASVFVNEISLWVFLFIYFFTFIIFVKFQYQSCGIEKLILLFYGRWLCKTIEQITSYLVRICIYILCVSFALKYCRQHIIGSFLFFFLESYLPCYIF